MPYTCSVANNTHESCSLLNQSVEKYQSFLKFSYETDNIDKYGVDVGSIVDNAAHLANIASNSVGAFSTLSSLELDPIKDEYDLSINIDNISSYGIAIYNIDAGYTSLPYNTPKVLITGEKALISISSIDQLENPWDAIEGKASWIDLYVLIRSEQDTDLAIRIRLTYTKDFWDVTLIESEGEEYYIGDDGTAVDLKLNTFTARASDDNYPSFIVATMNTAINKSASMSITFGDLT